MTETVAARLPATLACVRCNESWLAQSDLAQSDLAQSDLAQSDLSQLPQASSLAQQAIPSPAPSAPIAQPTVPPSSAVEAAPLVATELPLPPPFITPVAPMMVPAASEGSSAAIAMPERFSEQPIKFDQAALLRPDPPSRARVAWLISLLAVAVLLLLAVVLRNEISAAWPPSVRVYRAVGLAPRPISSPILQRPAPGATTHTVANPAPRRQAGGPSPSHAP